MPDSPLLPAAFADLAPLVPRWALATSAERANARSRSTPAERAAFYQALAPRAAAAVALLDAKPLGELDPAECRLLDLLLAFAHVSLAVEVQGRSEEWHAQWRDRMVLTGTPADLAA